jgi:hypothetical protein
MLSSSLSRIDQDSGIPKHAQTRRKRKVIETLRVSASEPSTPSPVVSPLDGMSDLAQRFGVFSTKEKTSPVPIPKTRRLSPEAMEQMLQEG